MAFNLRKPPRLDAKLSAYPYQLDAVLAVKSLPYAAVFHEQGLGKTKIAVDLVLSWLEEDIVDTVFVVTKKMLVQNWVDEIAMHAYIVPKILSGNRRENGLALNSPILIYVMNYETISANLDLITLFLGTCRVGVILDESQKIKNPAAKLTTDFHNIANCFARRIIMTGTPVANRPYDIWAQIKFLDDGESLGASFGKFKNDVDLPKGPIKETSYKHEYDEKLSKVFFKIKKFSVRETKKTAGLELPNKTILTHVSRMEPRQASIYEAYRDNMHHEIKSHDKPIADDSEDILKLLLRLVQCAANPFLVDQTYRGLPGKFVQLRSLLDDIDLHSTKVIIWTGFVDNVEWLSSQLSEFHPQIIHGRMPISDRNNAVRSFKQNSRCRILLATPGAAKEGLTLTVANHALFYDRGFSLDDYLQAQDRIHRISQTEDCYVHNLIAKNTIDEWVDVLLNAKYQAAQLVQGDISRHKFSSEYNNIDISGVLQKILHPDEGHIKQ